jgi:hypothetical protein
MYTVTFYKNESGKEGKRIYMLQDLMDNIYQVVRYEPDFVLVDIVSNDIADMDAKLLDSMWRQEIRDMVGQCILIAQSFKPEVTVCFLQVAPRTKTRGNGMNAETFEKYAKYYNDLMYIRQGDALKGGNMKRDGMTAPTNLRVQKMQGWRNTDISTTGGAREQYTKKTLDAMLSGDNIHPTLETFRTKYRNIVRKAITNIRNRPTKT